MKQACDSCGRIPAEAALIPFDGQLLCPACLEQATTLCSHCGSRIWNEENAGDSQTPLCQRCYDRCYTSCVQCGQLIRETDAFYPGDDTDEPYCQSCWTRREQDVAIHDYYFKPDPIFYGTGPRYFGVELEIDGAGEDRSNARQLLELANRSAQHIYIKHDGSLDDGLEIVTHPMTLSYHETQMPWSSLLSAARAMGYTSHQARTCGLHVHVSREAFGETEEKQDAVIARILYFFEKFWDELLKFSRRTPRQLERWAARYGYKEQPRDILEHAKKGCHGGRYTCVNLQNPDTVELRVFRGSLRYSTLMATLQLADRICDAALYLSDQELQALSWTTFAAGCQAPELVQYLKERRLYVNDPVDAEEEV